jgi:NAD(P)H-dependent flavin oxidoreductase YrpB (nitropropane dioxygenase family)
VAKAKLLEAGSGDTLRSRSYTGKPARLLRSAWTDEWAREDTPDPLGMPLQPMLIDSAMARINRAAHHSGSGAEKLVTYPVGQIVGSMNKSRPAGRVVMDMVEEFIESAESLARQLEI